LLPFDIWHNATVADMPTSYWCTPVILADAIQVIGSTLPEPKESIERLTCCHLYSPP